MDQSTHDVRCTNWLNIIKQCQGRPAGMSAKQWLAENDIKEKAYYYWLRKFRKEAYVQMQLPAVTAKDEVAFAEVVMPLSAPDSGSTTPKAPDGLPAAVIKYNGLTLELSNNISEVLLRHLLKELLRA